MGTSEPADPASLLWLDDEELAALCRWEAYRGSGPGGQKRNKTSSAIRITHIASGIWATATESRSQKRNRGAALQRLRRKLALELRRPLDLARFSPPDWLPSSGQWLTQPAATPPYWPIVGFVLDVLAAAGWSLSDAALALNTSTSRLVRFLARDPKLWGKVNQMRVAAGLRPLAS